MRPLALLSFSVLLSLPLFAQQQHEVSVSAGRTWYKYTGEASAAGASYNRFWSRTVSTRAGFLIAREEHRNGREDRFGAVHATAEYHPFRGRLFSPRVAAGVAYGDSRIEGFDGARNRSALSVVGGGGLDVRITPRFYFGAEALYIPFTLDPGDRFAYDLDPVTTFASARFRW
jgi:hypothetical protein